jgi:tetratricopeptide (TPR) repeat protein
MEQILAQAVTQILRDRIPSACEPPMADKPVIFISSTSDLRSARDLVGKVLYSMGYEPVWQEIAATDGGELLDVLRQRIAPASLVVQLVGRRYGAEPPHPTADFGRVSYTQFEALEAQRTGKKVIYHFLDDSFPTDAVQPEPAELLSLQEAYRQRLIDANRLRHDRISNSGDLELSIRRITDELAALRKQADRRHRNLVRLGIAALVGVAAVGILAFIKFNRQEQHAARQEEHAAKVETKLEEQASEMAALRAAVAAAVSPKPLEAGQKRPAPIPPEILEKAKVLVARGNAEERALGMIALKQHAEADHIIQELKNKPGNPIDEAMRLFTMEGDNWYQADEPDKAIEPYEKAVALKPRDLKARYNLVVALVFARHGDLSAHRQRAIKISEESLPLCPPKSREWAKTQHAIGGGWYSLRTGNRAENLKKAIAAYEAALTVGTNQIRPDDWAKTEFNLSLAWRELPTGNRAENLKKAMAALEAALTVHTKEAYPVEWVRSQNTLSLLLLDLPTGDHIQNVKKAIAALDAALPVCSKEAHRDEWGITQLNLGTAWSHIPSKNKAEDLKKAIAAYEVALTVYTKEAYPARWVVIQNNLGLVWGQLPTGNQTENSKKTVAAYQAALTVGPPNLPPRLRQEIELRLSWKQILAKDFAGALSTCERVPKEDVDFLPVQADHAHALVFLGRMDEARQIYRKYVGQKFPESDKNWEQTMLDDFDELEKNGLHSPEFPKLREMLRPKPVQVGSTPVAH